MLETMIETIIMAFCVGGIVRALTILQVPNRTKPVPVKIESDHAKFRRRIL